jgi:hypothetical protein
MAKRPRRKPPTAEEELYQWEARIYRLTLLAGQWWDTDAFYPRVGETVDAVQMLILTREARKVQTKERGGPMEEIVLSEESKLLLERRGDEGCVCCVYITSDFKKNGKLTDYPGNYPVEAKIEHVSAEKEGRV